MPIVLATSETCVMKRSMANAPLLPSGNRGSRYILRTKGKAKRLAAETRALSAIRRLTVARGQPRAKDVYCGRTVSMRVASPFIRRTRMTVNVGFGDEKRVRREVQDARHERISSRESERCCWGCQLNMPVEAGKCFERMIPSTKAVAD